MKKLLTIDGMACGHCTMKVKSELMAAVIRAGYRVTRIIGNH